MTQVPVDILTMVLASVTLVVVLARKSRTGKH